MGSIHLTDIQTALNGSKWRVVSDQYTNLDTLMTFECPEGHQVLAPWKKLRARLECPVCRQTKGALETESALPKPKGTYRILALDQATHTTGYAIFDNDRLVKYGAFNTSAADELNRMMAVRNWLISMISNYSIDMVGLEGIQFQDNVTERRDMGVTIFQTLARLQGILMMTCADNNIKVEVCPTNTWRHACGVKGRSRSNKKRSMQMLVKQWYDVSITDDEADAIGIGRYLSQQFALSNTIQNWEA